MKKLFILNCLFLLLVHSSVMAYQDETISAEDILSSSEVVETREIPVSPEQKTRIAEETGETLSGDSVTFYAGKTGGKIDGYCLVVSEKGKQGVIVLAVVISPYGIINDISVLKNEEIRGAKIERRRFLRQFIGKGLADPIKVNRDIDAVTGASVSSRAVTRAAHKALIIWKTVLME